MGITRTSRRTGLDLATFGGSVIKSVQRGAITIADASGSNTATITAVDTAKSRLAHLGQGGGSATLIDGLLARLTFTNSTTITATRSNTTGTDQVGFEVTEFY